MPATLNHIGIAVGDPSQVARLKTLFSYFDFHVDHVEAVPEQGVVAHFLKLPPEETHLELLEVSDPEGTVAKFVQKRGPGVHHLSFKVSNGELDSLSARLREGGYRLIYETAKKGAHEMRVNFIHPASAGGLLIEVMEQPLETRERCPSG